MTHVPQTDAAESETMRRHHRLVRAGFEWHRSDYPVQLIAVADELRERFGVEVHALDLGAGEMQRGSGGGFVVLRAAADKRTHVGRLYHRPGADWIRALCRWSVVTMDPSGELSARVAHQFAMRQDFAAVDAVWRLGGERAISHLFFPSDRVDQLR